MFTPLALVLNNQYKGDDAWEKYLVALENASPIIRALGVTDYYSTASYERVLKAKSEGRLENCALIFPNIEMRLAIGTVKGKWVNVHLLVSPDDPQHVVELKRFLGRLTFRAFGDSFACSAEDLIRLGRKANTALVQDSAALEYGSQQFKVEFGQLGELYREIRWAQENVLIAVAGSEADGTSGVRDAADTTLRQEVEKFAHVIFASSLSQRDFWLGRKSLSADVIRERYGGLKPCLHGSDAHDHASVGIPDGSRYSWIKGALEFDALRQACIEPAGRAFVGERAPDTSALSQVISEINVSGAPWAKTPSVAFNPGLVAIIGARGSGKTALVDMLAAACDAVSDTLSESSFLSRASVFLSGASVQLHWQAGPPVARALDDFEAPSSDTYPRARYLSQKFVEDLCSAHGLTDELLHEIAPNPQLEVSLVDQSKDLDKQTLAVLEAEVARLEKLVVGDRETANRFSAISRRIEVEAAALATLKERHADCAGAKDRANGLVQQREKGYLGVFDAIESEQRILTELYAPLMCRLSASSGTLRRLTFSVRRVADVATWAAAGESLLDLRHQGPFKGVGSLLQLAEPVLRDAWETGDSKAVGTAMAKFRDANQAGLLGHSPVPKASISDYRTWSKRFAQWLYSTDHISLHYSIDYEGVDIRKLSPGTRGIVLLLLYLALDDADDRPLIIDQPEENLDPKSIYDELVGLFIGAKTKRQVIMVTHNANLVVNADADQIIIAQAGEHAPGQLPPISYVSGGLESAEIRAAVCAILEGGEVAFRERARRLRIGLQR